MRILLLLLISVGAFGQRMNAVTKDHDAQIFIMRGDFQSNTNNYASDFSSARQNGAWSGAIDQLVKDYKRNGLWEKDRVIYPCFNVGEGVVGNAPNTNGGTMGFLRHRLNLKSANNDMAVISGLPTPGATINGTTFGFNSLGQPTNTALSSSLPENYAGTYGNMSYAFYNMSNDSSNGAAEMGTYNQSTYQPISYLSIKSNDSNVPNSIAGVLGFNTSYNTNVRIQINGRDPRGLNVVSRSALNSMFYWQNGVTLGSNSNTVTATPSAFAIYLGGVHLNNGSVSQGVGLYSKKTAGFITIGGSYTQAELAIKKQIIDAFFVNIGRQPQGVLPIANAGEDRATQNTSITLNGSASTGGSGNITNYTWTQISGNGGSIITPNAAVTDITGLSDGVYTFRLTITNSSGATASDDVNIYVSTTTPSYFAFYVTDQSTQTVVTAYTDVLTLDGQTYQGLQGSQFQIADGTYVTNGVSLTYNYIGSGVTGTRNVIPLLLWFTKSIYIPNSRFVSIGDTSQLPKFVSILEFQNNLFSTQKVNEILGKLVNNGLTGGRINISGQTPAAPPTGQGITDKATLISRGWTVTTD